jgi:hypothetical protein
MANWQLAFLQFKTIQTAQNFGRAVCNGDHSGIVHLAR